MKLRGGCATDRGNVRTVNQDAIFFQYVEKEDQYFALGAVCDGVGGLSHGEVASCLVIRAIEEWFQNVLEWIDMKTAVPEILFSHLKDTVEECNRTMFEMMEDHEYQMGTTLSALMMLKNRYYILQAGDSRVYLYRKHLQQLTVDHVVSRIKGGKMKQYLTNYIGKGDELWFETAEGTFGEGDVFLYASDGFCHFLQKEDMEKAFRHGMRKKDINDVCIELIETMKQRGERDNISVGLICIDWKQELFQRCRRIV